MNLDTFDRVEFKFKKSRSLRFMCLDHIIASWVVGDLTIEQLRAKCILIIESDVESDALEWSLSPLSMTRWRSIYC